MSKDKDADIEKRREFEAFKKSWEDYPSQDNEGYVPDRGGFKCGWFAALEWSRANPPQPMEAREAAEKIVSLYVENFNGDLVEKPVLYNDFLRMDANGYARAVNEIADYLYGQGFHGLAFAKSIEDRFGVAK